MKARPPNQVKGYRDVQGNRDWPKSQSLLSSVLVRRSQACRVCAPLGPFTRDALGFLEATVADPFQPGQLPAFEAQSCSEIQLDVVAPVQAVFLQVKAKVAVQLRILLT